MPIREPIATEFIDNRITAAKCSECDETLDVPNEINTPQDQELALEIAFAKHVRTRHS